MRPSVPHAQLQHGSSAAGAAPLPQHLPSLASACCPARAPVLLGLHPQRRWLLLTAVCRVLCTNPSGRSGASRPQQQRSSKVKVVLLDLSCSS